MCFWKIHVLYKHITCFFWKQEKKQGSPRSSGGWAHSESLFQPLAQRFSHWPRSWVALAINAMQLLQQTSTQTNIVHETFLTMCNGQAQHSSSTKSSALSRPRNRHDPGSTPSSLGPSGTQTILVLQSIQTTAIRASAIGHQRDFFRKRICKGRNISALCIRSETPYTWNGMTTR